MSTSTRLHAELERALKARSTNGSLRTLETPSRHADSAMHDFSSNDYLDLSHSSALRTLFMQHLNNASDLASTGSRLLSGNSILAHAIEEESMTFWNSKDALLCASGYEANVSLFATLPQINDTILFDELVHASVHVGMRASRSKRQLRWRHSDVLHLRDLLVLENQVNTQGNTFLAIESVYSMDGDVAPLDEILSIVREVRPSTYLIIDEAHATGVFGDHGRGLTHQLSHDKAPEILARLHTLGKGASGTGAVILCDPLVKQYLLNYAKGLIYSTYMSVPALCLALASLQLLQSQHNTLAKSRLWNNIMTFEALLNNMAPTNLLSWPARLSSPIVPIITPQAVELSLYLRRSGYNVMPVRYPTVQRGKERLRICLRADIPELVLKGLVSEIEAWSKRKLSPVIVAEVPMSAKI